jgi:hypothetical protein
MNELRVVLLLPLFAACQTNAASSEAVSNASVESVVQSATTGSATQAKESNSAEPAPSGAVRATKWSGSYSVAVYRIDRPSQQVAWLKDDGRAHSGEGVVSVERTTRDEVAGTARGPLGEQRVVGAVDGSRLTLSFAPSSSEGAAFRATAQCEAAPGDTWSCTLSAVSSNGNLVRAGSANLRPRTPGAVP